MATFTGKRILVTGADGFIGSHLCETLVESGAQVRALSLYNSFNSWGWLEDSKYINDMEIREGDVRDVDCCRSIIQGMDYVFNLAALIAIPYSYQSPSSYIETNVKGALNLCSAARDSNVQGFIQISTSEVYGTAKYVPIDEAHPLQPQSPYSASKIGSDAIAMSFYHSFNLPVVIARPFNAYGPRQSARAVIPTVITQIGQGFRQIRLGDTSPTRDFNYVTDTCKGMIGLGVCAEAVGKSVNIGSNTEISILETVEKIIQIMGKPVEIVTDDVRKRPEGSEVMRLRCDNTLLKQLTGYSPDFDLDQGLEKTIDWFSASQNLSRYKGGIYNV